MLLADGQYSQSDGQLAAPAFYLGQAHEEEALPYLDILAVWVDIEGMMDGLLLRMEEEVLLASVGGEEGGELMQGHQCLSAFGTGQLLSLCLLETELDALHYK